ncbi:DoxX family protein [Actinokineospora sp.]|uniref:DoxX family protein n=1 Tax=Actinokineospora sp. TaxID=1872133 RepID=UPI003D6A45B4
MSTTYTVVTIVGAAMAAFSAGSVFLHAKWVVEPLADYGVPRAWWPWLGAAKAAGAAGMMIGLFVPVIGLLAAIGLILYFTGAVITVARARWYSHLAFPLIYLAPVVASLALRA